MRKRSRWVVTLFLVMLALPAAVQSQDYIWTTNADGITLTITKYTGPGGDVTIPDRLPDINGLPVTSIGISAFRNCTSLSSITIPSSVTSIGDGAFSHCSSLGSITIPSSVTSIGISAFDSCFSLSSITIPSSVISIGNHAFSYCFSLSSITVDPLNSAYSSLEGVLFNQNQTTLIQCPADKAGVYLVPSSVSNIGERAFYFCTSLSSVTIPSSVTSIGYAAFSYCASLTSITVDPLNSAYSSLEGVLFNQNQTTLIQCPGGKAGAYLVPSSVTSIGDYAFSYCTSLSSITIPSNVTSIGNAAFDSCTGLSSITIPSNVTSIGNVAFSYCTSLTGVYFQGNAPSVGSYAFAGNINAIAYYLPGTTNWGATFGGPSSPLPTALWQPQIQTSAPTFGLQTNQFGFNIAWSSGMKVAVDACTNLADPVWIPLQTNTLPADTIYYSDPDWTNSPRRYYRVRWP